jgi:hypothetical protein
MFILHALTPFNKLEKKYVLVKVFELKKKLYGGEEKSISIGKK